MMLPAWVEFRPAPPGRIDEAFTNAGASVIAT